MSVCKICKFASKKCICQPFWSTFNETMNRSSNFRNQPTPLTISTITFKFKLKNATINLSLLSSNFQKSLFMRNIKFRGGAKKSKGDSDLNYNFYNQCSITSFIPHDTDNKQLIKVSTKIFHNGSFNVTGVRSISGIVRVIRKVLSVLSSYEGVIVKEGNVKLVDTCISMINTDFTIRKKIRQKILLDTLENLDEDILVGGMVKRSSFEPDKYHGVKIKYVHNWYKQVGNNYSLTRKGREKLPGELTISVFNTGSVIITGGNTAEDTMGAYEFINRVFDRYHETLLRPGNVQSKKKKKVYNLSCELSDLNLEKKKDSYFRDKSMFVSKMEGCLFDIPKGVHNMLYNKCLLEIRNLSR